MLAIWEGEVSLSSLAPALVGTSVSTTNPSPSPDPNPDPNQLLLEKHPFSRKLHAKCLRVTMELLQQAINYRHPLYVEFFPRRAHARVREEPRGAGNAISMQPILT